MATLETEIPTGEEETGRGILPSDLPSITLDETTEKEMSQWIETELNREIANWKPLHQEWEEIQELCEATELESKKDFPFSGAANVMIGVIPMIVEEAWAWSMGIIFAPKYVIDVEPKRSEFNPHKEAVKQFIAWALREEIGFEEVCSQLFLENAKLGMMIAKTIYTVENRTLRIYNPSTKKYEKVVETIRHSPEVIRVPDSDFLCPIHARSAEDAAWKAHRFRLQWPRVVERANDGRFDKECLDKIKNHYKSNQTESEEANADNTNTRASHIKEHEFYELWYEYALKANAEDQEDTEEEIVRLVATYHKESGTLCKVQHNWYPLQLDPFSIGQFLPREGKIVGLGVGRIGVPTQLEVSAMHCQRLDNATIVNTIAYKYRTDSLIPPNLTIRPGGGIPMDDPEKDMIPLVLGQKYDSTLQEEEHTLKMFRDRVGIGKEIELGETSTNAIVRQQEARVKSNAILKSYRRFITDIVEKVLMLYQQFYPEGKIESLLGEQGTLVEEFFRSSPKSIYYGIGLGVTATNSAVSKDLDRQNKLSLFNLLAQYYDRVFQLLAPTQNPQVPPALKQASMEIINGLGSYVRELLDDFDIPGRDKLVIEPEKLVQLATSGVAPQDAARDVIDPRMADTQQLPPGGA